jgi:TolB-like protein
MVERSATVAVPTAAAFNPPAQSIAVLPFVNMSGDPRQDYFSDGISEELLDSLSRLEELQVAARTSSFSLFGAKKMAGEKRASPQLTFFQSECRIARR